MQAIIAVLIPHTLTIALVIIVYFFLSYSHKERLRMLKMGLTPPPTKGGVTGMSSLWLGLLGIAIGGALLVSQIFAYDRDQILAGIIIVFIGAGLLAYYRITESRREQQIRLREEYQAGLVRQMDTHHDSTIQPDGTEIG